MTQEQRQKLIQQYVACREDPILSGDSWGEVDVQEMRGDEEQVDRLRIVTLSDDELLSLLKDFIGYDPEVEYEGDDGDLKNVSLLAMIIREIEKGGEK